jgi:hypothetical protein
MSVVSLPSTCLIIATVTYAKKHLISEVPSPHDIYTGFKEHSSTGQSLTYPTEKLVETVGTAVTVLENVMSMGCLHS